MQTDNGSEFGTKFRWHLEDLDIRHVRIRPRTPRLNGKVERSHRIDNDEFYRLLDKDDDIHLMNKKVREWENYYNHNRPHGGLGGQTPFERFLERTKLSRKSRCIQSRTCTGRALPLYGHANWRALSVFCYRVKLAWWKWLSRRSQRARLTTAAMTRLLTYPLSFFEPEAGSSFFD